MKAGSLSVRTVEQLLRSSTLVERYIAQTRGLRRAFYLSGSPHALKSRLHMGPAWQLERLSFRWGERGVMIGGDVHSERWGQVGVL